jgi:hypothetical protein
MLDTFYGSGGLFRLLLMIDGRFLHYQEGNLLPSIHQATKPYKLNTYLVHIKIAKMIKEFSNINLYLAL